MYQNLNPLLDYLIKFLDIKNSEALARVLNVRPSVISKLRHGALPLGATILMRMHEETGIEIAGLKAIAGDFVITKAKQSYWVGHDLKAVACKQVTIDKNAKHGLSED